MGSRGEERVEEGRRGEEREGEEVGDKAFSFSPSDSSLSELSDFIFVCTSSSNSMEK